jgi:O-antigen ligase
VSTRTLIVVEGPAARSRSRRPQTPAVTGLDRALVIGLALLLIFAVTAFGAVEEWSELVLECGAALLLLLWAAGQWRAGELRIHSNALMAPMLAFAVLVGLQIALNLSAYRHATVQESFRYLAYGMLFFVASQALRRRAQLSLFLWIIVSFGFVLALIAILQDLTAGGKLYWIRQPRFSAWAYGPYVNHNHWAGFAEMVAPLPLALAASSEMRSPHKALLAFATTLLAATIFLSGSRGGMLAFMVQVVVGVMIVFWRRQSRRGGYQLAALLVAVLALAVWLGGSPLLDRAQSALDTEVASRDLRMAIARDSVAMIKERPLIGWGLDNFVTVYPQYRSFVTTKLVNAAHNDYIQVLAETGVIGLALVVWFLVALFRSALHDDTGGLPDRARIAALVACTGILVHSLTDFNLHIPANAALFYTLCAVAISGGREQRPENGRRPQRFVRDDALA